MSTQNDPPIVPKSAKEKHRVDRVKLAVVQQLEAFAKRRNTYLDEILRTRRERTPFALLM
jgi:hypothetical protein